MSTSCSNSIPDTSIFQNSFYVGVNMQNILYGEFFDAYHGVIGLTELLDRTGMELVLYFKAMNILLSNRGAIKKSNLFYALFSSTMVFLVTVWVATSAVFGEKMWLLDSNFPGGPEAYLQENISVWYLDWGTTSVILLQLMTDGLMVRHEQGRQNVCSFGGFQIYRCRILWDSYLAIVVPVILWLSTLILGVLVDWSSSSPGGDFFTGKSAQLALAYYTLSVFLNTTLSCMICYCILQYGRKVREYLGHEYASLYLATITLVVESVLPYTLSGIAFLVSLGVGSPLSTVFISVYLLMMVRGFITLLSMR
ncbi:hypothetical protein JVT61DRAFT_1863 [Boletus reticuloceps]|uniref:Uncharacterized protein n=1 Tax=Boletus reticuloceps TaxID=495285 RepID=A0A8I2YU78_9AGAM|nr:hypothetical protein JVT61DRAFT_1863 [Boletus reticuloceps]